MDIYTELSTEKVISCEPLEKSSLPLLAPVKSLDGETYAPYGKWICSTDLLQGVNSKQRPRLLPHGTKTYVFIPDEDVIKTTILNIPCYFNCAPIKRKRIERPEGSSKKETDSIKINTCLDTIMLPPKKRFLRLSLHG